MTNEFDAGQALLIANDKIADLEAKLAALDWTPITAENWPRQRGKDYGGDEALSYNNDGSIFVRQVDQQMLDQLGTDVQVWKRYGWLCRRPINAPAAHPGGQEVQK